jgi:hypothetical protein
VTGYGHYGINVETSGAAYAPNVIVVNNTVTNNGTGVNALGLLPLAWAGSHAFQH